MKQIWPNYYPRFSCIAQECEHTCCAGWEIDIDPAALSRYQNVKGSLGERLRESICIDKEGNAHFELAQQERCPFLNKTNLCELILELGEDSLCQICADHPRFRNFFSDRTEIGVGLCCEAAAMLILSQTAPMVLCDNGEAEELTQEEEALLSLRSELIQTMQNRGDSIAARWHKLQKRANAVYRELSPEQWASRLLALERLDRAWEDRLADLQKCKHTDLPFLTDPRLAAAMEQLTCYFLYRHMAGAMLDGDAAGRAAFCVLSAKLIGMMYQSKGGGIRELAQIARLYSSEIEYSEENLCAMLDLLDERIVLT